MSSKSFAAFLLAALASVSGFSEEARPPRSVVVVVWDGMRPDFISADTTPNLWKFAAEGVFFAHHHPVYCSSTEVNGIALATGAQPSHSFVIANVDYRPAINPQNVIAIEAAETIRRGDEVSGGHYVGRPTVAEILHEHGWRTVIAGSKPVAMLHDRSRRPNSPDASPVLYEGSVLPPFLEAGLANKFGDFPPIAEDQDKMARDAWTTRALTQSLWSQSVPPFSLLWLSEPDFSQHATAPGSAQSLAAVKSDDNNFGLVLAELERRGLRQSTDVIVVSDHGFSTIGWKVDVAVELSTAGFHAERAALGGLKTGDVLVVSEGGSSLIYVGGHEPETIRRVAAFLQIQDWCGVVLSRKALDGTFPLAEANIASPQAPDLVVSLRWSRDKSLLGISGLQTSDSPGKKLGNHASLSPFDMHNTLVAAGPDFRKGVTDTLPTGNTDVAPTVLWLLGLKEEAGRMDGRILGEALAGDAPPLRSYEIKRLSASRRTAGGEWNQYLQVSEVNGVRYLDEGNGAFTVRAR
jgi:arylsulfatase A-like enzyme